jgi:hypothetical protein
MPNWGGEFNVLVCESGTELDGHLVLIHQGNDARAGGTDANNDMLQSLIVDHITDSEPGAFVDRHPKREPGFGRCV